MIIAEKNEKRVSAVESDCHQHQRHSFIWEIQTKPQTAVDHYLSALRAMPFIQSGLMTANEVFHGKSPFALCFFKPNLTPRSVMNVDVVVSAGYHLEIRPDAHKGNANGLITAESLE